jgi:AcrR family transcriptional regulator
MVKKQRPALSRDRVLRTAVALADEAGVDAISMRRLGQELGVEAMSLYNHVANKGDLIDGMVELVLAEVELPSEEPDWQAAIRRCATSFHDVLLRHPWAAGLVLAPSSNSDRIMESPRLQYMEWLLGRLRAAGFSADATYHAYHALDAHIVGFTLWQLGHMATARELVGDKGIAELAAAFLRQLQSSNSPNLAEHVQQHLDAPKGDDRREFEFGLDLILDGLRRANEPVQ